MMTGPFVARSRPPLGGFLLLVALFIGLMVMHGLQSTPSPSTSPSAGSGLPGIHLTHDGAMVDVGAMRGAHAAEVTARVGDPSGGTPVHRHPGGQVCLGLLVLTSLLTLFAVALDRGLPHIRALVRTRARIPGGCRPPPLSIFQLAVMRL